MFPVARRREGQQFRLTFAPGGGRNRGTMELRSLHYETIRLMVQQGVGASILPHSSVYRECARGLAEAHRITADGVFRTLALGVAASRSASSARNAVAEIVTQVLADIEADGKLRPRLEDQAADAPKQRLRALGRAQVEA